MNWQNYFDDTDFPSLSEDERTFVRALMHRPWAHLGLAPDDVHMLEADPQEQRDYLMIFFDICAGSHISRTLRLELSPDGALRMGRDETMQGGSPFDEDRPEFRHFPPTQYTAAELAEFAVKWLSEQLRRPVELHEWRRSNFVHKRLFLADTGEWLMWSDTENMPRPWLGPPDTLHTLRDYRGTDW